MLKRIIPVLCVVVIACCCLFALPVSAASTSYPDNSKYERYSVLQFDTISINPVGVFEWPCNIGVGGSKFAFSYDDSEGYPQFYGDGAVSGTPYRMNVSFRVPAYSDFQLKSDFLLLSRNGWEYDIVGYDQSPIHHVTISGTLQSFEVRDFGYGDGEQWSSKGRSFSVTLYPGTSGYVDIYQGLLGALPDDQQLYLITDLCVDVEFTSTSVETPRFMLSCDTSVNDPTGYLATWVFDQNLESKKEIIVSGDSSFDVLTWLKNVVGGFLDVEIAPGFSLNKIFYLILIIGVLMTFFKVFS